MARKTTAKPTDRKPTERAPIAAAPRARAVAPKPPRGAHGRAPESGADAAALDAVPEQPPQELQAGPDVSYPIFPTFPPGTIELIRVYRTVPRTDGVGGLTWHEQALPWQAALTTWDDIKRVCGGGRFVVVAVARGKTLGSARRSFEGPPRTPTAKDVASISPGLGLSENGQAIYETPNGWVSIPDLPPAAQAAFIAFQQVAYYARDDAHKAISAMALLTQQLAQKAMQPDPGLAVLESLVQTQRETMDKLYTELNEQRNLNMRLKIAEAAQGSDVKRVKVEALKKGMDLLDGVAGTLATKLLAAQESEAAKEAAASVAASVAENAAAANAETAARVVQSGSPNALGEALARRLMEARQAAQGGA